MGTFIAIVLAAVLTENFITVRTYGICPFLGVSKKTSSAVGMGVAVTLVMAIATAITYPLYQLMKELEIEFLEIIFFIFIIAALVQMIEQVIKKVSPPLYKAMGIYLPLITTNCAVLGVCEMVIGDMSSILGAGVTMNTGLAILYAVFAGLGFTLVMIIMSGLREKIDCYGNMPKALKGFPIAMITASIICMAFTVFSYITI